MTVKKTLAAWGLVFLLSSFALSAELAQPTRSLNGTSISYEYTSGRAYNVKFDVAGVSYRYLTGSKPEVWWGPFPYQAFEIDKDVFSASWFEEGCGDYVTLLMNFNSNLLYGSAILHGEEVHFHGAQIKEVKKP